MVNPNILRFDGPVDHYFLRPMGIMRCPPAPPAPPARPQVDIDDYLHLHEPAFDRYVTWQKESIALTEAAITTARRARDAAEFKQWAAIGTLLPAMGLLATSYAMMFTFPFIVPGAILFAVTSVGIALLVGYEERARSEYNEANAEWQRASWVLESQKASLDVAERTFVRLQTQFAPHVEVPSARTPRPTAPPAVPQRRARRTTPRMPERIPSRDLSPASTASSVSSEATSSAASDASRSQPGTASYWTGFVPSADVFGWRHYEDVPSSDGVSTQGSGASAASRADTEDAQLAPNPAARLANAFVEAAVPAPNVVEGWGQD